MKRLLRGVIDFQDGKISDENLRVNFQRLLASEIEWSIPSDDKIFGFVKEFFASNLELPTGKTILDYFTRADDIEVQERLGDIEAASVYTRNNYTHLLGQLCEDQGRIKMLALLKETQEIVSKGIIVKEGREKKRIQGIKDAVVHFNSNAHGILPSELSAKTQGNIRDDMQPAWDEYQTAKLNKDKVWGKFTGIEEIDVVCHGLKRGEMWVHAAFAGELKCLPGDATVFDHAKGRRRTLKELHESGDLPVVTAAAHEGIGSKLVVTEASHLEPNGQRPVYDITLVSGRTIGATSNHKFLTLEGWKPLSQIEPGERVATPRVVEVEASSGYSLEDMREAGDLIGRWDRRRVKGFDQRVPDEFFGLGKSMVFEFLKALWYTCPKGILHEISDLVPNPKGQVLVYCSSGRGLCLDIQSLLLRFGFQSSISQVDLGPEKVWVVLVDAGEDPGNGDFFWDTVGDISYRGVEQTFDLEVPEHHTFVANDIVTHNTVFAINWAYNLVTRYRTNVLYCSFEMPYEQLRRIILVRHSANPRFLAQGKSPLDYRKVRDGELTEEEEEFYKEVLLDWDQNEEYCRFHIWCPDKDVNVDDVRIHAELLHKEMDVGFIVLDHGGLMESRKKHRDYTIELNSVLRDSKKLALHFNSGEGVPLLMLFQINRDGKDAADKAEGKYKIRALSYSNECLAKGTLVHTSNGLVPIEKVEPGSRVHSSTGWKTVAHRFEQGARKTVLVRTSEGLEVTCTPDHLFQTVGENGLKWVQAKDLHGRYVLADIGGALEDITSLPLLPRLNFEKYEKPFGQVGKALRTPKHITPELSYLMGAHDGDDVKADAYRVGWTGNRGETFVRSKIQRYFEEVFKHEIYKAECPSRPGSFDLSKWSKSLSRWFESVGMDRGNSVSRYILEASATCQAFYLRGLWDTDGSINNQGILALGLKRENRVLLQQVQLLMLGLGIPCSLSDRESLLKGKVYYKTVLNVLTLKGKRRFLRVIGGFTEPAKQRRLEEACDISPHDKTVWPIGPIYLRAYERYKARGLFPRKCRVAASKVRRGHRQHVTQAAIKDFLEHVGPGATGDADVELFQRLIRCRPQQVVSVTGGPEVPVFDLEVSGDHEYSTGGLLTHNCERSADTVTTTYLNDTHRENGTTMCCCLKNRDNPHFQPFLIGIDFACRRMYRLDPESLAGGDIGSEENDEFLDSLVSRV